MNRDILIPAAALIGLIILTGALVVLGQLERFEERTSGSAFPTIAQRTAALHRAATGRVAADTAARTIAPSPASVVDYAAYRILFELDPDRAPRAVLEYGRFRRGERTISGLKEAADLVFGARPEALTDVELALFSHWVVHGQSGWSPDAIMDTRQRLLRQLLARGVFDTETHDRYAGQPLVLRPTPVPID